ncbi:MAG: OadG family protein [Muribaculaceae bacterium]|nr:OadG family protein [Muribaculaceae bacterium]
MKNRVSTGIIMMAMAALPLWASASVQTEDRPVVVEAVEVAEVVPAAEEEHTPLALQAPETGFQSDYGESKIARRMTQAEKNQNAAENDGWGGAITIIAMCIVVSALVVLSVLFMLFGKVSQNILTSRKKKAKAAADHPEDENINELAPGEVIAAISFALTQHFSARHDIEDHHLTIKRLQKAYSPWNSKIYNLRQNLDHKRN